MSKTEINFPRLALARREFHKASFWENLSEAAARQLRSECRERLGLERLLAVAAVLVGGMAGATLMLQWWTQMLEHKLGELARSPEALLVIEAGMYAWGTTGFLCGSLAAGVALMKTHKRYSAKHLYDMLAPAAERPGLFTSALEALRFPAVRAFRDKAAEGGRILRVGDLMQMLRMADQLELVEARERDERQLRALQAQMVS